MANLTLAELSPIVALGDVIETSVEAVQVPGLATPEARKLTLTQKRQLVLRLADLTALLADNASATTLFPVYDSALGDANTNARKMTLAQFRQLVTGGVIAHGITPKVGTTAGWVVNAANNLGKLATIPAAQTASTLVVPITGLKVGDVIWAFSNMGSIQSGGNVGTFDSSLRMLTANAAGAVDSLLGSITQVSVTANTILSESNAKKVLAAPHTVAAGESFYVLITATTGAAVTQELQQILVTTDPTA